MRWLVILTGVAGSGRSTIASGLVKEAHAILLRTFVHPDLPGSDPTECEIVARRPSIARIAWSGSTGGVLHGMLKAEFSRVPAGGVGVVVVDPTMLPDLNDFRASQPDWEIVTVGLDTVHDIAEQRARLQNPARRSDTVQTLAEIREQLAGVDVRLEGNQAVVMDAALAVCRLIVSRGGMLTRDLLKPFFAAGSTLTNFDAASLRSASYDLRVGDEAWCGGFVDLTTNEPFLEIPPYSYAIVKAMERAALPTFMAGQFDLRVSYFLSGIILSNGPQVDPGYRGDLFCMLFNGNSEPHRMRMGDRFCTIQFVSTVRVSDTYAGDYSIKERLRRSMPPNAAVGPGGAIFTKLTKDIEAAKGELRSEFPKDRAGLYLALISILAGISIAISIWAATVTVEANKAAGEANKAAVEARAAASASSSMNTSSTERGTGVTQSAGSAGRPPQNRIDAAPQGDKAVRLGSGGVGK